MNWVDKERKLTQLLVDLIDIPSPTGHEGRIGEFLEQVLTGLGLRVMRQELSQNRFNLLARTDSKCRVLLSSHMDTVLPHLPSSHTGEIIRGRGACDAKGALVSMIAAAENLLEERVSELGLLFVVGEEKDSDGARQAGELELDSEYVILGEPTDNTVATGQKGSIVFRVEVTGVAAHSACPDKGRSAIHSLVELIGRWTSEDWGTDPLIGQNSLNVGRINGGVGANVISADAFAEGVFRIGTDAAKVRKRLLACEGEDISIQILSSSEPMRLHVPAGFDRSVASFGSDAPYLRSLGKVIMLGPGSIEHAHGSDEQVSVGQLVAARELYVNLTKQLLSS
jgi:acetylornithine deacetylase